MGILSRFRDVMKANVNSLLARTEDPEKTVNEYMRSLSSDLGQVKAETAAVLSEESRAKRALDECSAEMKNCSGMQRSRQNQATKIRPGLFWRRK